MSDEKASLTQEEHDNLERYVESALNLMIELANSDDNAGPFIFDVESKIVGQVTDILVQNMKSNAYRDSDG